MPECQECELWDQLTQVQIPACTLLHYVMFFKLRLKSIFQVVYRWPPSCLQLQVPTVPGSPTLSTNHVELHSRSSPAHGRTRDRHLYQWFPNAQVGVGQRSGVGHQNFFADLSHSEYISPPAPLHPHNTHPWGALPMTDVSNLCFSDVSWIEDFSIPSSFILIETCPTPRLCWDSGLHPRRR